MYCNPVTFGIQRVRYVLAATQRPVNIQLIIRVICDMLNVTVEALKSPSRKGEYVEARHLVALIIRQYIPETSYARIGMTLGHRDHSTILASVNQAKNRLETERLFAAKYEMLTAEIERLRKWRGNNG